MKNHCKCALRDSLKLRLKQARKDEGLTQVEFSEKLMMDPRSYSALEKGDNLCCTLAFIIYLVDYCRDVPGLVDELRKIIHQARKEDREELRKAIYAQQALLAEKDEQALAD